MSSNKKQAEGKKATPSKTGKDTKTTKEEESKTIQSEILGKRPREDEFSEAFKEE